MHSYNKTVITDEQLMLKVLTKDKKAFFILTERWQKPIINFFYRQLGNKQTAEDLAQEVFIKLWKAKNYNPKAPFYGWIYTIARNKLIDFQRKKRHQTVRLENNPEVLKLSERQENNPEQIIINQSEQELIKQLLDELPPEQKTAIILSKYQKLPHADIARIMNCSQSAAKVRVFRAVNNLVKRFKKLYEHE